MNDKSVREVQRLAAEVEMLTRELLQADRDSRERGFGSMYGTALSASLRRRSMDLTRALAKMRRP